MLFKGGSAPMTQALPADSCDKMRDFLNSLLRANQSARSTGNRIDITEGRAHEIPEAMENATRTD